MSMLLDVNWSSILLYSLSLLLRIVFSAFPISNPNPNINIIPHSLDYLRKKKLIFIRINKFCLNIYQTSRNLSVDYPQSLKFTLFYWSLCFACCAFTLVLYTDIYYILEEAYHLLGPSTGGWIVMYFVWWGWKLRKRILIRKISEIKWLYK